MPANEQRDQIQLPDLRELDRSNPEALRQAIEEDFVVLDHGLALADYAVPAEKAANTGIQKVSSLSDQLTQPVAQTVEARLANGDVRSAMQIGNGTIKANSAIIEVTRLTGTMPGRDIIAEDVRAGFATPDSQVTIDQIDRLPTSSSMKYTELQEADRGMYIIAELTAEAKEDLVNFADLTKLNEIDPFTALDRLGDSVKALSEALYTRGDMNIVTGAAVKAVANLLDDDGIRKAIGNDDLLASYFENADVSPAQMALTLTVLSTLENQGASTDLDTLIDKLSEAGAKRGFGKQADIRKRANNIHALVNLPNTIHNNHVEAQAALKEIKETVPRYSSAFTRSSTMSILEELDQYIDLAGNKLVQAPEEDKETAMLEALEVDAYKHEVVKKIRNQLQGTPHANDHEIREVLQNFSRFRLDRAIKGGQVAPTTNPEASERSVEQLQDLLGQIDALHKDYQMGGKALRAADPGLVLTNVFREGYKGSDGQQLIEATDAEQAKITAAFLLIMSQKFEAFGVASFDQLLVDLQTEHDLTEQLQAGSKNNRRPAFINNELSWIIEQSVALRNVDNQAMSPAVKNMLQALSDYVNAWQNPSEVAVTEEAIDEPMPEPEQPEEPEPAADVDDEPEENEAEPEPETDEVPPLPDLPGEVINQAGVLDFEIFPPGATLADVAGDVRNIVEGEDLQYIDWNRLRLLIELRDHYSKNDLTANLWRAQPGSLNSKLPYYALVLEKENHIIVVADNPQYGNATYVFEEKEGWGTWQEVASMPRLFIRDLYGGRRIIHPRNMQLDNPRAYTQHRNNINKDVIMFLSAQEAQTV